MKIIINDKSLDDLLWCDTKEPSLGARNLLFSSRGYIGIDVYNLLSCKYYVSAPYYMYAIP